MSSLGNESWTEESRVIARAEKIQAILESDGYKGLCLQGYVSDHERTVVDKLREAGVIVVIPADN